MVFYIRRVKDITCLCRFNRAAPAVPNDGAVSAVLITNNGFTRKTCYYRRACSSRTANRKGNLFSSVVLALLVLANETVYVTGRGELVTFFYGLNRPAPAIVNSGTVRAACTGIRVTRQAFHYYAVRTNGTGDG